VVEVTMAEEDVADAGRIDVAGQKAPHHAQAAARVEQHPRGTNLDQHGRLIALRIERAAGAEEDDARARHRARA
jgi:hypothetical protein